MLTFDEARQIVDEIERPLWDSSGTYHVAIDGEEDSTHYCVHVGAREWLVHGDMSYAIADDPARLVDKETGEVDYVLPTDEADRLDAMTPVTAQDSAK